MAVVYIVQIENGKNNTTTPWRRAFFTKEKALQACKEWAANDVKVEQDKGKDAKLAEIATPSVDLDTNEVVSLKSGYEAVAKDWSIKYKVFEIGIVNSSLQ